MRIAYFSPLPPLRTGIAAYSRHLLPALARLAEVTPFHAGPCDPVPGLPAPVDFTAEGAIARALSGFDQVVYHLGNNPHFHLDIYRAFLARPGTVVLHDAVLWFLMAGGGRGAFLREFAASHGPARLREAWALEADCPGGDLLRYPHPARHPLLRRVLDRATAVVVHSAATAEAVREAGYAGPLGEGRLVYYPEARAAAQAVAPRQALREAGIADGRTVFGCFGFLGPTKRMASLLEAFARARQEAPAALLVVGEGEDVMSAARRHGVADDVVHLGYAPDERFDALLAAVDVVVNLRYPSMGEASATLVQAMSCARPCIVTRDAWFAELPEEAVHFVPHGEDEVPALASALARLAADPAARARLGEAALRHAEAHWSPDAGARRMLSLLEGFDTAGWARRRLAGRLREIVPP